MRRKCINCTSGRKSVTENKFSDIDFLLTWKVLSFDAAFAYFGDFSLRRVCACAVSTILLLPAQNLTSHLNSAHPFSYKDAVISENRGLYSHLAVCSFRSGGFFIA